MRHGLLNSKHNSLRGSFLFSLGEQVAIRLDEGPVGQAEDEQRLSFLQSPHPPLSWSPLSQLGLWYAQIFLLLCELEAFTELLKALQAM